MTELTTSCDMPPERWNAFVSQSQWPDFELMQSYEWGQFKEALGWQVVRLAVERDGRPVAGAQMLIKPLPLKIYSIAYVPRGPLLLRGGEGDEEDEENEENGVVAQRLVEAMHAVARRHRAIVLTIEPPFRYSPGAVQWLQARGFRRSRFDNQPQCSILIDLTPSLDDILARMHKTTRYNIRYSGRHGVTVRTGDAADLDTFYHLLASTARQAGFPIRSRAYYRREWEALAPGGYVRLFLALYEGEVLAMRLPARFGRRAATLHSGSSGVHRKLKPNELLMWESLRWAKSQGCTTYDVWGIPAEVGAHLYEGHPLPAEEAQKGGLWGVYRFKRGFGGEVVYYVGAYDFVYSPLMYRAMNLAMARLGSLERLARLEDAISNDVRRT